MPEAQREQRLAELDREDPSLAQQLRQMLAADHAGSTSTGLEAAAPDLVDDLVEHERQIESARWVDQDMGPWRLQREIGRGGMGAVWLANRADGAYEGLVAIKLMRSSFDGDDLVRRFKAERQILAGLDHPNIARLVDAGADSAGRPYLALEYVDGQTISDYCDARRLSVEQRIGVFLEVCAAVAHAHQRLVVHRDLKPSNILVTAEGRVRLLDFGIAKLVAADDLTTRTGVPLFTAAYAAPEQIRGEAITTGVDVHALGLLLYELLCGMRAFGRSDSTPAAYEYAILHEAPAEPSSSALLSIRNEQGAAVDDTQARAAARRLTPNTLARRLSGDLDAIVQMALRKEPEKRYPSVDALADDLRRHLAHEPVAARRGRLRYRLGRFLKRHALASALSTLALVSILLGLAAALWQADVAMRERDRAQTAQVTAENVVRFVTGMLSKATADAGQGRVLTVREVLDTAAAELVTDLADRPEVRVRIHNMLAAVYNALMENEKAEVETRAAMELTRSLDGERSLRMLEASEMLYRILNTSTRQDEAGQLAAFNLELATELLGPLHQRTLTQMSNHALHHYNQGRYGVAADKFRDVIAAQRSIPDGDPRALANMLHNLAAALTRSGQVDEADEVHLEALAIRRSLFTDPHTHIAAGLHQLGLSKLVRGEYAQAIAYFEEARAQYVLLLGADSAPVLNQNLGLARVEVARGDHARAITLLEPLLQRYRDETGLDNLETTIAMSTLAQAYLGTGRAEQALQTVDEAIGLLEQRYTEGHANLATALRVRLHAQRELDGALDCQLAERILTMFKQGYEDGHRDVQRARADLQDCAAADTPSDPAG